MTRLEELEHTGRILVGVIVDGMRENMKCCPNCANFEIKMELCHNAQNCPNGPMRPPADVIAFGCPRFVEKVPF